ncbi:hypothetical protein TNCV_2293131 [Trichonephila clavipes]|nr:hypothetical protein TNCV_2293131 [Trichonephila clavipes]
MWSMVAQRLTQITPPAATPDQLGQQAQWLSGSVSRFHAIGPGFKSQAGQVLVSLSSLQWVDKGVPNLLVNWTLGILHQTDYLIETSTHAPQRLRSRKLK